MSTQPTKTLHEVISERLVQLDKLYEEEKIGEWKYLKWSDELYKALNKLASKKSK